ncbi:MAG: ATP synthase F1 subunit epsilon [Rickettsiales bacterium]|nr:ATP synthase F1 subunit epsilon [Rickettsiales bacterium]OUV82810.1 MAG: ATP synthase F1 subunit epsilon [Rickettsiales bacterium TMED131]|tara:strand:+ start:961 stop:1374 length:414 start_codon:yes stop_codon:yes gene_type:complete
MSAGLIKTKIISPDQEIYSGNSEMVVLPGEEGDFAAMFEHAPLITYLRAGKIEVFELDNSDKIVYFVSGGFVKVEDNICMIMVDYIKKFSDIDVKSNEEKISQLLNQVDEEKDDSLKSSLLNSIDLLKSENSFALEH